MRTIVPDYYDRFHCLAGACPHSCCEKWEVVIDEETAVCYGNEPGPLGEKLRAALQVDEEGDFCFPLQGGRCPFLNAENLCEIHCQLGREATSITCREHPRFIEEYGPFREVTLSASCPEANRLLLESQAPLTFVELETEGEAEEGDGWLAWLLPLRARMLTLLTDRTQPLRRRMGHCLALAWEAQQLLDEEREEEILTLLENWTPWVLDGGTEGGDLFHAVRQTLCALEILEPDWPELLERAELVEARGHFEKKAPTAARWSGCDDVLERIAVYFAFRYLLKAVNDGDLLGRVQLCLLGVLTVERLAAVCGPGWGTPSQPSEADAMGRDDAREETQLSAEREAEFCGLCVAEALRRFSCEIEHSGVNVDGLLEAFWQREELSVWAFARELERGTPPGT